MTYLPLKHSKIVNPYRVLLCNNCSLFKYNFIVKAELNIICDQTAPSFSGWTGLFVSNSLFTIPGILS